MGQIFLCQRLCWETKTICTWLWETHNIGNVLWRKQTSAETTLWQQCQTNGVKTTNFGVCRLCNLVFHHVAKILTFTIHNTILNARSKPGVRWCICWIICRPCGLQLGQTALRILHSLKGMMWTCHTPTILHCTGTWHAKFVVHETTSMTPKWLTGDSGPQITLCPSKTIAKQTSEIAAMGSGAERATEEQLQKNIWKIIWFNGIFSVFSSIAQLGLFDTYLFIMAGNSNTAVGWAESISGLSQIVLAGPAGILTDTCSRSKILNWCVLLAVLAVGTSIAGVGLDNFPIIYASLFVFGAYSAIQNTASFALYSDSIPQGSRAKWLSRVSIVNQIGYGAGPFLSLFLFAYFGNEWQLCCIGTFMPLSISLKFWDLDSSVFLTRF